MSTSQRTLTREERRKQLQEMWRNKREQATVLSLYHRAMPPGQKLSEGRTVFDVILDEEFHADDADSQQ